MEGCVPWGSTLGSDEFWLPCRDLSRMGSHKGRSPMPVDLSMLSCFCLHLLHCDMAKDSSAKAEQIEYPSWNSNFRTVSWRNFFSLSSIQTQVFCYSNRNQIKNRRNRVLVRMSLVWPRKELGGGEERGGDQRTAWALVSGLTAVHSTMVSTFTEPEMQFPG